MANWCDNHLIVMVTVQSINDPEAYPAARAELEAGGVPGGQASCTRRAHLRYQGTDTSLPVPLGGVDEMVGAFEAAYRQRFSFLTRDKPVIVEAVENLDLSYPKIDAAKKKELAKARAGLARE